MKIIVFGSTGTIGKELVKQLSEKHEVIGVSRNSTPIQADYTDEKSYEYATGKTINKK